MSPTTDHSNAQQNAALESVDSDVQASDSRWDVLKQLFRYGMNCFVVLGIKLFLVWLLIQWMIPTIAYFIVHIATFFISYAIHTRKTFDVEFSWNQLKQYFYAVIGFKVFDYLAFNVLFTGFKLSSSWSVVLASASEALVKFLFVRKALIHPGKTFAVVDSLRGIKTPLSFQRKTKGAGS